MAKLILVKYCKTCWNKENRLQGAVDIPLNDEGVEEARKISEELSQFDISALYSGSAPCSVSTANEIAAPHKVKVKEVSELNELNYGLWQGLYMKDIKKRYKRQYSIWKTSPVSGCPPQGEAIGKAYDRAVSAVHKIIDHHKAKDVCIVSGSLILSLIKCNLRNIDLGDVWNVTLDKNFWEAIEINNG
ncbi:MAG: histidine phosphatase family protein [Candidatus Omnitrophota bacterium]